MKNAINVAPFSLVLLCCFLLITPPESVYAATLHVPAEWSTIQAAIDAAGNGDTVLVAPGTYYENIDFKGKDIRLLSENGPDTSVIDGGKAGTVVTFQSGEGTGAVLQGFQICHGLPRRSFSFGGGVYIRDASPVIRECFITKNGAHDGGGIFVEGHNSSPLIENNLISQNIATEMGGGIEARHGSTPQILGNDIVENVAMNGSAIFVSDRALPVIGENTIRNNNGGCDMSYPFDAEDYLNGIDVTARIPCGDRLPGAIFIADHSSGVIRNNTIETNIGGGIGVFLGSTPFIQNNMIRANYANRLLASGMMIAFDAMPTMINNTIKENQVGAIWIDDTSSILDEDRKPISFVGYQIIEDTDEAVSFVGNWDFRVGGDNGGGSSRGTGEIGGTASVRFTGTGVSLVYSAGTNSGKAAVRIDGIPYDPVDMYVDGERRLGRTEKLLATDLSPSEHILEITATGEKNPLSSWNGINVDAVGVLPGTSLGSNLVLGSVWVWSPSSMIDFETVTGSGRDRRVPGDHASIQSAIDAADEGDTIIVSPGIYSENIDFMGKRIAVVSQDPTDEGTVKTTIIQAVNQWPPTVVFARGEDRGTKLEGFTIRNPAGGKGIFVGSAGPTIKGNIIRDCPEGGIACSYSEAPLIIQNSIVHNGTASGSGIECFHSTPEIRGNTISENSGFGIGSYFAWPVIVDNTVNDNKGGAAISLDHMSIATIRGNTICRNKGMFGGIYLDFFCNSTIEQNTITENTGRGLFMILDCSPVITNNLIARNDTGLTVGMSRPQLMNNTIVDNTNQGIYLADIARAFITNTILWNAYAEINLLESASAQATYSLVEGGWPGAGNLSQNPRFQGVGYQLSRSSPCIDSGTSAGAPDIDIVGKARPKGNGYDMGAYEYADPTSLSFFYFPHVASNSIWETEICVVNTHSSKSLGIDLKAYNDSGQEVDSKPVTLTPNAREEIVVGDAFSNPSNIGYIILESDSKNVCGYTKFYVEGKCRAAVPATSDVNAGDIYISHIASNADWWTGISLLNTVSSFKELNMEFDNGTTKEIEIAAGEHKKFTIKSLFDGELQPSIRSGVIKNATGLVGLELFGSSNESGSSYLGGIALKNNTATDIYYPHITSDSTWWTGIVAYNPSTASCELTITPFSEDGAPLPPLNVSLGEHEKYVGLVKDLKLPLGSAWIKILASNPITGFELFGTNNGNQLGGYTGVNISDRHGVFSKAERDGWTGIAFVNIENTPASVTVTAYDDAGDAIAAGTLRIEAYAKVVDLAPNLFQESIKNASYISYLSDKKVVGFQLNGSSDNMMLDALPALGENSQAGN